MNKQASILIVSGDIKGKIATECIKSLKKNTDTKLIRETLIFEAGIRPDFNHAHEINKALKIFSGDYIVLLDDDVVLDPGWLQGLIDCAEKFPKAGVVGAVLKNKKGEVIHTGATITDQYFGYEFKEKISKPKTCRYVCSAVMLITREAAEKIGPFDETFLKYGQDADYCFRAWEAGYEVFCTPDASAVHLVGGTVNNRPDMQQLFDKDKNTFYSKWRKSDFYNNFDIVELGRRGVSYPTFACNIKCCFCYYYQEENRQQRPFEEMKAEMDLFRNKYKHDYIDISGGEPTIYKNIKELVAYCRSIGLLPTIITNGQRPEAIGELIDAGLEDVLMSVHGYGEDCNKALGKKDGFDNILRAVEIMKGKNFSFRTNTTMISHNYQNLPKLALELIGFGARIVNFISFNPHEGTDWSKEGFIEFQIRYSELAKYLKEAIDILSGAGIWANVRYFPLCALKGYEKHICNFHQWQWDPYEWDYIQGYKLDDDQIKKIKHKAIKENLFGYNPDEKIKLWIAKHWSCDKNIFFDKCKQCSNRQICDGVYSQYAKRFGQDEFEPYSGDSIQNPLHYRLLNQSWRKMKS